MLNLREQRVFLEHHPGMVLDEVNGKAVPIPTETPKMTYQVEFWPEAVEQMRVLFDANWKEVILDREAIKLEPDYLLYDIMAKCNVLHLVTARYQGEVVGYHLSFVHPHLHYKSSLTAFTDAFYVKPEFRTGMTGYKLLRFALDSLRARKVQKMYVATTLQRDIGCLLDRLGFTEVERMYAKVLT